VLSGLTNISSITGFIYRFKFEEYCGIPLVDVVPKQKFSQQGSFTDDGIDIFYYYFLA
jgi:hypothetical protein